MSDVGRKEPEARPTVGTADDEQRRHLALADDAATRGDWFAWAKALWDSRLPIGTVHRLMARHEMQKADAQECVSTALAELMTAIMDGKRVRSTAALFWEAADRSAIDLLRERARHARTGQVDVDIGTRIMSGRIVGSDEAVPEIDREELRTRAIALARTLLPRIQASPARVLEFVLGAMEAGATLVPTAEIAETLDMEPGAVRVNLHRGFRQLAREASAAGILPDTDVEALRAELTALDGDDDVPPAAEEEA